MLGLEKRVEAVRQMYTEAPETPEDRAAQAKADSAASTPGSTGVMLALGAIAVALGVYFVLDAKYDAKLAQAAASYEARLAVMESRVAEAMNAPREMARKLIVTNALTEVSHKVEQIKGNVEAQAQKDKLGRIEAAIKELQQELQ